MTPRSAGPSTLIAASLWLLIAVVTLITPADPDLWGHLRFGGDILATGQIVQADRFSFTSDRPWINHEWLSEVTFASIYRLAGPGGLIALKAVATIAVMALVWWHVRRQGAASRVAALLVLVAFITTHWRLSTVRPQIFSVLLFALLLLVLADSEQKIRWRLWLVVPMLALWANMHGGWIVGLGTLLLWIGLSFLRSGATFRERATMAIVAVAATLATLVNPYGVRLWEFLWETVGLQRPDIQEWKPLWYSWAVGVPWTLTVAALVLAWLRGRDARTWRQLPIVAVLGGASMLVSRLDAFFALSVIVLLAPELLRALRETSSRRSLLQRYNVTGGAAQAVTFGAIAAVVGYGATILWPAMTCISMDSDWVPERGAGRFIRTNHLQGRMVTWFDWGEYAIWHYGPELQVSYDGRRETVYTNRVIRDHGEFYDAGANTQSFLAQLNPNYIWVPNRLRIANRLESEGWTRIFRGSTSSIFSRRPIDSVTEAAPPAGARCFPDS